MVHRGPEPLAIALCASLCLHAMILAPSLMVAIGRIDADQVALISEPPPETLIGIEESTATSVDWIGYAEYEEHLAQLSETNQAAFTEAPSPAVPPPAELVMTPTERAPESIDEGSTETDSATEMAAADEVSPSESDAVANEQPVSEPGPQVSPAELQALLEVARSWAIATLVPRRAATSGNRQQSDEPASTQARPAASTSPPSDPSVGETSDKDSDPSATIDVSKDQWVLGKPLAAHGGELHPRRMEVTALTRITALVHDALVVLEFDHRGIVVKVTLVQSSGHAQVDKNMIDSLYGWRATGGRFAELSEDETIEIELRYLLSK